MNIWSINIVHFFISNTPQELKVQYWWFVDFIQLYDRNTREIRCQSYTPLHFPVLVASKEYLWNSSEELKINTLRNWATRWARHAARTAARTRRRSRSASRRRARGDAASDEGSAPPVAGGRPVRARRELAGRVIFGWDVTGPRLGPRPGWP